MKIGDRYRHGACHLFFYRMNLKPEAIRPVEIRTLEDKELYMEWQDGHRSLYPFPYLRRKCRCAGCVNEWTGHPTLIPEKVSETIRSLKMSSVGNYGIRFEWSDGHSTGIYAFEYLRSICPCKVCLPPPSALGQ